MKETTVVPDYTQTGFEPIAPETLVKLEPNVLALNLEACLGAGYDSDKNEICFNVPIYGDACVKSPIEIPVGGKLKACVKTCGRFLPTGVKATIYLNDSAIWSGTIFGSC